MADRLTAEECTGIATTLRNYGNSHADDKRRDYYWDLADKVAALATPPVPVLPEGWRVYIPCDTDPHWSLWRDRGIGLDPNVQIAEVSRPDIAAGAATALRYLAAQLDREGGERG